MEFDWQEITGYFVSGFCFIIDLLPHTCDGWTRLIGLIIALLTLFFVTLPKAWPNIKKFFGRK